MKTKEEKQYAEKTAEKEVSLKSIIGEDLLLKTQDSYLNYLKSSAAIYEVNGEYAAALFSSKYCDFLNQASMKMAGKTDKEALKSGKWICHEDCWATSLKSIKDKKPCEMECSGGIKIYAAPIIADSMVIGSNNAGVSNPPVDEKKIKEIAEIYKVNPEELLEIAREYSPRSDYVLNAAKNHILIAGDTIAEFFLRKKTEEAVVVAREYTDNVVSSMIDTLIIIDPKGNIRTVNQSTLSLLGYKEKELIGKPVGMIFAEEEEEEEEEEEMPFKSARLKKVIKEGSLRNYDMTYKTKSGGKIPVSLNGSVMRETRTDANSSADQRGKIIGVIIIARDMRERKKAEEKNKILSDAIDAAIDGIIIADTKGIIFYVNQSMAKMYGYEKGEMIGRSFTILNPDPNIARQMAPTLRDKGAWHGEILQKRKNKETFMALLALSVIRDEKGKVIGTMGAVRDITLIKKTQEELIRAERMAGVGQLAAGVAHEFNNLLNIIGGSAEYAKGTMDEKEIKEALNIIMKSSNRGADIVKSLLIFAGRIEPKKEFAYIVEVIEETLRLVGRDMEKSGISISRGYADVPKIVIDTGQIQQVFLNILLNAQKAMRRGGRLSIILGREDNFVKVQFHNTGKHIDKKDLSRIFAPFFKLEGKRKEEPHRTGLGLSVSHGIIEAHGGTIEAESKKGKGTTFTVRLPISEIVPEVAVLEKKSAKRIKKEKTKVRQADILVVDDEKNICNLFKKVLEKESHVVNVVNNGRTAVNLCKNHHFDLIYLDIIMPGIDGIETFKKIKKNDPDAKIILITGKLIEDKVAQMYIDKGVIGFIRKPISNKELVRNTKAFL